MHINHSAATHLNEFYSSIKNPQLPGHFTLPPQVQLCRAAQALQVISLLCVVLMFCVFAQSMHFREQGRCFP